METIERDGYTIEIRPEEYDLECFNPRDYDNLGTMVCWHPDYVLGDFQITNEDGRGAVGGRHGRGADTRFHRDDFKSMRHLARYLGIAENAVGILPLYLYDHSGISMTVGGRNPFDSAGWDTTMCGFIYTTRERIRELCGDGDEYQTEEWIAKALRDEVGTYNQYLTGDVYSFTIEHRDEVVESLGGIFGWEDAKREANEALDAILREPAEAPNVTLGKLVARMEAAGRAYAALLDDDTLAKLAVYAKDEPVGGILNAEVSKRASATVQS